jgi:hypothetical protein
LPLRSSPSRYVATPSRAGILSQSTFASATAGFTIPAKRGTDGSEEAAYLSQSRSELHRAGIERLLRNPGRPGWRW